MQVSTINLDTIEQYKDSDIASIIKDWGNRYCVTKAAIELKKIEERDYEWLNINRPVCNSWAALWHRNGHDYIHRSKMQPFELDRSGRLTEQKPHTERLYKLLTTDGFKKQMKGNMILYKAGSIVKSSNVTNYPIRLTDGRYCFITGNLDLIMNRALRNKQKYLSNDADLLFNLWFIDNIGSDVVIKGYEGSKPPHISALFDNHITNSYRRKCWKIYMLLTHYDKETWESEFDVLAECENSRAGFIIWQRGEIIKHWERGVMPHPRY